MPAEPTGSRRPSASEAVRGTATSRGTRRRPHGLPRPVAPPAPPLRPPTTKAPRLTASRLLRNRPSNWCRRHRHQARRLRALLRLRPRRRKLRHPRGLDRPGGRHRRLNANFEKANDEGTKVFFSTAEPLVEADTDHKADIYMRDLEAGTTTLVSQGEEACARPAATATIDAAFAEASADGTVVFFVTEERLSRGRHRQIGGRLRARPEHRNHQPGLRRRSATANSTPPCAGSRRMAPRSTSRPRSRFSARTPTRRPTSTPATWEPARRHSSPRASPPAPPAGTGARSGLPRQLRRRLAGLLHHRRIAGRAGRRHGDRHLRPRPAGRADDAGVRRQLIGVDRELRRRLRRRPARLLHHRRGAGRQPTKTAPTTSTSGRRGAQPGHVGGMHQRLRGDLRRRQRRRRNGRLQHRRAARPGEDTDSASTSTSRKSAAGRRSSSPAAARAAVAAATAPPMRASTAPPPTPRASSSAAPKSSPRRRRRRRRHLRRDLGGGATSLITTSPSYCPLKKGNCGATFADASTDGRHVFFTSLSASPSTTATTKSTSTNASSANRPAKT